MTESLVFSKSALRVKLSALTLAASALQADAQRPAPRDSSGATRLDPIVVIAERTRGTAGLSTAAVSRLTAGEIARMPTATLADALQMMPGVTLISFDGVGLDPQLMVRGFYGGGEVEYVSLLVDGRPVAQLQSGRIAWDALPPVASIEAIEFVRGSSSALYGDAALGGVLNIITKPIDVRAEPRWDASRGSFDAWRAMLDLDGALFGRSTSLGGGSVRSDGFRAHSDRFTSQARLDMALVERPASRLTVGTALHWREFEEPGALLDSILTVDRAASDPLFRFDETNDRSRTVFADLERQFSRRVRLTGSLLHERRKVNAIRTLALAPGFGDTKERVSSAGRLHGALQLDIADSWFPGVDQLVLGGELNRGTLDSRYYLVTGGDRDSYETASGTRGALDTSGDAQRTTTSFFAQYGVRPKRAVRFTLGARYDRFGDEFNPTFPTGSDGQDAAHAAFSPKVGLNLRYRESPGGTGNIYVSVSRSFKAPTLDQLYDQRNIPVPFPPFEVRTSNGNLSPQRGGNIELGLHQTGQLTPSVTGVLTVTAYQMDMKDELDFDVTTFQYVNIGRSRHRGLETGVRLLGPGGTSTSFNHTLQAARSRSGAFSGNHLKAIPRHTFSGGVTALSTEREEFGMFVTHQRGAFIDDANALELPSFTTVDAHASFLRNGVRIFLNARNLFNTKYNSTGFLDPAGTGQAYYYPAARRTLEFGARTGW